MRILQLYTDKLGNQGKMDKLLETGNLPRLSHEEIENLKTDILCFNALCFTVIRKYFLKKNRFVTTLLQASLSAQLFSTEFALFLSLCHILLILTIVQTFFHY